MKDYYATLKIQQGRLKQAMHNAGVFTSAELSKVSKASQTDICELLNFRKSPRRKNGEWRVGVLSICAALSVDPSEIFPEHLDHEIVTNKIESFVEHAQLANGYIHQIGPSDICQEYETEQTLNEVLETLTERERSILKSRFWEGKTLAQTGKQHNIGGERAKQIEAKALRKLRHPTRLNKLKEVCDYSYLTSKTG